MDIEEEIVAFGETQVWVTCDRCGRVYGGPGLRKSTFRVEQSNLCLDCVRSRKADWGTSAEGVGPSRPARFGDLSPVD